MGLKEDYCRSRSILDCDCAVCGKPATGTHYTVRNLLIARSISFAEDVLPSAFAHANTTVWQYRFFGSNLKRTKIKWTINRIRRGGGSRGDTINCYYRQSPAMAAAPSSVGRSRSASSTRASGRAPTTPSAVSLSITALPAIFDL